MSQEEFELDVTQFTVVESNDGAFKETLDGFVRVSPKDYDQYMPITVTWIEKTKSVKQKVVIDK